MVAFIFLSMIKKLMKNNDLVLKELLAFVNGERNSDIKRSQYQLVESARQLDFYAKEIKRHKKLVEESEQILTTLKDKSWKTEDLIKSVDQLKKHKDIEWAVVTSDLFLIFQTKPLFQYHGIDQKQLDEPIGRYAIKIDLRYMTKTIHPIDFEAQGHRHPNLMLSPGNACWGGLETPINQMIKSGEYFNAVDTILAFLSTFPHNGGHKPQYWLIWLNERKINFQKIPWIIPTPIHEVGKLSSPIKMKFKIKRVPIAEINDEEIVLDGLNFRSF